MPQYPDSWKYIDGGWVRPRSAQPEEMRELKQVLTDYYITDLASLGAVSGDVVQICQVVEGVVGWWSHAEVS